MEVGAVLHVVAKVDVGGRTYALRLNPQQLSLRDAGDLITAEIIEIIDVAPVDPDHPHPIPTRSEGDTWPEDQRP